MAKEDFIEHIFQRATEEFDIEFNPTAWQRMEKKLDRARRRRKLLFWLQWVGIAALVLLVWWWFGRPNAESAPPPTKALSKRPIAEAIRQPTEQPCPEEPMVGEPTAEVHLQRQQSWPTKQQQSVLPTPLENTVATAAPLQPKDDLITIDTINTIENARQFDRANKETNDLFTPIIVEPLAGIAPNSLIAQTASILPVAPTLTTVKPAQPLRHRWTAGLIAAPEAVTVGLDGRSQNGYNVGALLEYRFLPRFSLSTQGVYAQKKYVAGAGAFRPPRGAWLNGIAPLETLGECEMLEATLALRTEILQQPRWNLVASTGVSSWWMLREWYDYDFPEPLPNRSWQTNRPLTHWWAMAQLSLGAELKIARRLSIQGDLYTQIPLKGVGRGQVQLYSQGFALSLRRRF